MSAKPRHNQYILAAAGDHEILSQAIENFRKLFSGNHLPDVAEEFAALRRLLDTKLPHHFAYEEAQIFPSLLVEQPQTAKQIAELCEEHVTMLREAQRLRKLLEGRNPPNCTGALWTALLDLFAVLQQHTVKEDKLFRPYLAKAK